MRKAFDYTASSNFQVTDFMMNRVTVTCRRCRFLLLSHPDIPVLTAHGENVDFNNLNAEDVICNSICSGSVWYVEEDTLPEWITNAVDEVRCIVYTYSCIFIVLHEVQLNLFCYFVNTDNIYSLLSHVVRVHVSGEYIEGRNNRIISKLSIIHYVT